MCYNIFGGFNLMKRSITLVFSFFFLIFTIGCDKEKKVYNNDNSIDNNIDIYIIPEDTNVKFIKNTSTYNPLLFKLIFSVSSKL